MVGKTTLRAHCLSLRVCMQKAVLMIFIVDFVTLGKASFYFNLKPNKDFNHFLQYIAILVWRLITVEGIKLRGYIESCVYL